LAKEELFIKADCTSKLSADYAILSSIHSEEKVTRIKSNVTDAPITPENYASKHI
jgi:hypothetical protein